MMTQSASDADYSLGHAAFVKYLNRLNPMGCTKRLGESGASEEELFQLEAQIGFTLPNDYPQFHARVER